MWKQSKGAAFSVSLSPYCGFCVIVVDGKCISVANEAKYAELKQAYPRHKRVAGYELHNMERCVDLYAVMTLKTNIYGCVL